MTHDVSLSFIHRYEPGRDEGAPALLLLHGTGGDENDLIGLGAMISPGSALLAPRGKVLEAGMPRFFRRLSEGVFDEADVRARADELAQFIHEARRAYGLAPPVAVGFSNGANIAAALLLTRPQVLAGAVLMRAMVPLAQSAPVDLEGRRVLLLSGSADPIVPEANAASLAARLQASGAVLDHRLLPVGHGLSQADISLARDWLKWSGAQAA